MTERGPTGGDRRARRVAGSVALSMSASLLVVASSWSSDSRLGAPLYWAWILTGFQVLALWAAGRRHWWAWLLGAGVQPVWIVYALLTGQLGFIPGCLISAAVQVHNYLKKSDAELKNGDAELKKSDAPPMGKGMVNSDYVPVLATTHSSR